MQFSTGRVKLDVAFFLVLMPALLCGQSSVPAANAAPSNGALNLNLYIKVELDSRMKLSAVKPGEDVEGTLSRSVYSQDKQVFPAGSRILLTVDKLERGRRAPNDHWPWVIKAFTPRHEKYPTFRSAEVTLADGEVVPLRVKLLSIGHEVEVHAPTRREKPRKKQESSSATDPHRAGPSVASPNKTAYHKARRVGFTANFEAAVLKGEPLTGEPSRPSFHSSGQMMTLAAGTQAKVLLLEGISASKSRQGDSFQARLVEPVYFGSTLVLPEGSLFEGKVVKKSAPHILSRPGSMLLSFTAVTRPAGATQPIAASVAVVELDRCSHTRVDPEGQLEGDRPGKAWMAMNLGVTGGIAKEADDGAQLLIEAIVSSATDVSTAGTARIAGACASSLFIFTRHGRDVVLPKFTEMDIVLDRPVSLSADQPVGGSH